MWYQKKTAVENNNDHPEGCIWRTPCHPDTTWGCRESPPPSGSRTPGSMSGPPQSEIFLWYIYSLIFVWFTKIFVSYTAMLIITKLYWLYPDHLLTLTKDNHCVPGCKIELWRDKYLCQLTSLFSVLGWLKGQLKQRYGQLAQVNGTIGHRRRRS